MNFSKLWQQRDGKAFSEDDLLGFDLLYQLSYMSAISAAGISRSLIFEYASRLDISSSRYFREVHRLQKNMNYSYSEACRLVGESTKQQEVKSLLLRLSASLSSGQPERDFMAQEARVQAECYQDEYERKLETLRKWTDGYIALLVSSALIIVVAIVSMVIYSMGTTMVGGLVAVMAGTGLLGAWIVYRAAPREIKPLPAALGPKGHHFCRTLLYLLAPPCLIVCALLLLIGVGIGWVLMVAGAFLLPIGLASIAYDRRIDKRDAEIGVFLRSAGRVATAIGTTVTDALERIDIRSMHYLAPFIRRLRTRLLSRLKSELCWQMFVVESESELINRSVTAFRDAIHMGADAQEVGLRTGDYATKIQLLRAKRRLTSATFSNLCLMMHATLVGLLIFIVEIVTAFARTIEKIDLGEMAAKGSQQVSSLMLFNFSVKDMQFFYHLLIPSILLLTFVNALVPKLADGGHNYKIFYYLGITLATSGASLVVLPRLTSLVFTYNPT
jgi:flagellar protein FlaJ